MKNVNTQQMLALALDPARILQARGIQPDPWQRELLLSVDREILLCCSRQVGKSTVVSALALHVALFTPNSLVLLLSPSQRQSCEIFRKVVEAYHALARPIKARYETQLRLELANGSRVVCLPGREETVRSFGGVNLLVLDEAARIRDDLYRSVRPMLAVSQGRLVALSTPFGQRGWFFDEWTAQNSFRKIRITWNQCPRITEDFIRQEIRSMGQDWVDQEYNCLFSSIEGLVYPDFASTLVLPNMLSEGSRVGGIDFGWRNPFAALLGVLDHEDVLWIVRERYLRETPLHEHRDWLKAQGRVLWYADPAGRTEIEELRTGDLVVRKADNDIRAGIAAVTARIRTGRLKVYETTCPNLIQEARLYRYPNTQEQILIGENPVDDHNHALAALRYLISRLDARFIARFRKKPTQSVDAESATATVNPPPLQSWLSLDNESLWT
jgi:hypothetical protein